MWCSRFTRPPKKRWAIYRDLVNLDVVLRFLTFLCLILVLFCSVLRFWIPFERKTKAVCRILKKLKVICLTCTGLCPKVKKEKKQHHKDGLSCICISWHSNSTKQTWETDQLPTQSEIKVFAVSPRRLLGANTRCKEARIRAPFGLCMKK